MLLGVVFFLLGDQLSLNKSQKVDNNNLEAETDDRWPLLIFLVFMFLIVFSVVYIYTEQIYCMHIVVCIYIYVHCCVISVDRAATCVGQDTRVKEILNLKSSHMHQRQHTSTSDTPLCGCCCVVLSGADFGLSSFSRS